MLEIKYINTIVRDTTVFLALACSFAGISALLCIGSIIYLCLSKQWTMWQLYAIASLSLIIYRLLLRQVVFYHRIRKQYLIYKANEERALSLPTNYVPKSAKVELPL